MTTSPSLLRNRDRHPVRNRKVTPYATGYRMALGLPENAELAGDPSLWVSKILNEWHWSKQKEILRSVATHRYTAVQSCHGIGKSYTASRAGTQWVDTRPDPFLVTTAPTWKQVNSILWREMRKAFRKGGLNGRINLDAEWFMNGDDLVGFGRKPADYDQAAFQGIHALNVLVVIDEAGGVPKSIFDAVDSLVTNKRGRVLAIGNPDDPTSHFAEICRPGSGWNVIQVSAFDTPGFIGHPEYTGTPEMAAHDSQIPDQLLEYLTSPEWVEERKKRWGVKSPIYISKVLGQFPEISDDTLFSPKLIREAQLRDLTAEVRNLPGQMGVDVARFGDGFTAVYRARGGKARLIKVMHQADTVETAEFVNNQMKKFPGEYAYIDAIGVGGGVYDQLIKNFKQYNTREFISSEKAYDPIRFGNRRAEVYWAVRDMADNGLLDLPEPGEDDELIAQLGAIKYKLQGGKVFIESKEEMKERGLPSPDRADAMVMALIASAGIMYVPVDEDEEDLSLTAGVMERQM